MGRQNNSKTDNPEIDTHKYAQLIFDKGAKAPFHRGKTAFSTNHTEATVHPQAKQNKTKKPQNKQTKKLT